LFSKTLIEKLKSSQCTAALTGAGISAESGVPTFRGKDGIWKKMKPQELASIEGFMKNPELVWEWYKMRREIISNVECNPGHKALARMEDFIPEFWLITQNVDDLHNKAGSRNVLELHGNILRNKCIKCQKIYTETDFDASSALPRCSCGGLLRPDVVWFGEMLPAEILHSAFYASKKCDVFLSIGTSAQVQPAASLPVLAKDSGAYVVEINKERTPISDYVDEVITGQSGEILPDLIKAVWG